MSCSFFLCFMKDMKKDVFVFFFWILYDVYGKEDLYAESNSDCW